MKISGDERIYEMVSDADAADAAFGHMATDLCRIGTTVGTLLATSVLRNMRTE